VYLTVLCDCPYPVSSLFAVLLSLHLVTFLMFFISTCITRDPVDYKRLIRVCIPCLTPSYGMKRQAQYQQLTLEELLSAVGDEDA